MSGTRVQYALAEQFEPFYRSGSDTGGEVTTKYIGQWEILVHFRGRILQLKM